MQRQLMEVSMLYPGKASTTSQNEPCLFNGKDLYTFIVLPLVGYG